jgi:uncharacterized membrane protein
MTELPHEEGNRKRWLTGLAAAGRTFFVLMGTAGFGLVGGLAYGAWVASHTPRTAPSDDVLVFIAWVVCLVLYGAIGFVIGLAAGLLVMAMIWILRLAKHIAGRLER